MEKNPFLPLARQSYSDLLRPIDGDALRHGLLGHGLFGDKLPPVFTSEAFDECLNKSNMGRDENHDWIRYRYMRNVGSYREFGIPNPFAYARLVQHISDNWGELREFFGETTATHPYRASRITIRKIAGKMHLFEMNYTESFLDGDPLPALIVGKRYRACCDISRCFPSVYTHALEWALIGKEEAKKAKGNKEYNKDDWHHQLDHYAMNTTNGETHGLLIGPHASNLLAEIILAKVDDELFSQGFYFVRYIDDYNCYTNDYRKAEAFPIAVEKCLSEYGLSLNQKKTTIDALPDVERVWSKQLGNYSFAEPNVKTSSLEDYLSLAQACTVKEGNNAAILNYALKRISSLDLSYGAINYLATAGAQLLYLYPYLLPLADSCIFSKTMMSDSRREYLLQKIFDSCLSKRDYLSASYCIYYAIRFTLNIKLNTVENSVLQSGDCMLLLFSWVYYDVNDDELNKGKLKEIANDYYESGKMDQYWLFIYEVLGRDDFKKEDSSWRGLKNKNIKFIKKINEWRLKT